MTQHNAAMVEESTAASQILRNDASELANQVAVFKVNANSPGATGATPTHAPSSAPAAHAEFLNTDDDFFADNAANSSLPKAVGWDDF